MIRIAFPVMLSLSIFSCEKYPVGKPAVYPLSIDTLINVRHWKVSAVTDIVKMWDPSGIPVLSLELNPRFPDAEISFFSDSTFRCDSNLARALYIPFAGRFYVDQLSEGGFHLSFGTSTRWNAQKHGFFKDCLWVWTHWIDTAANSYHEIDCLFKK